MPDANDKEKEAKKTEGKKEYDSIKNVEDASKKTADYLLGNLKTDELKADEQKDQNKIQSKNQEIEAKDAGGDTDYANITEKIAYGILIIGAIAIAGLIICSLLVAIFSTPIPAIVFSVFAATASVTACLGLATYISKFFVGIGQSVARTKFKG